MPVIECVCGVQLHYQITDNGRREEWGDQVRYLDQAAIQCARLSDYFVDD